MNVGFARDRMQTDGPLSSRQSQVSLLDNQAMKKSIALVLLAASTFFLAGCCTTPHVTKWEYKVADLPHHPRTGLREVRDDQQSFLKTSAKRVGCLSPKVTEESSISSGPLRACAKINSDFHARST
ncbi:hypothetical protein SBV1_370058 [Verrucomicrobia bacterium]|nr:hypothetical protein SBV1_370058 [Verrucomicrobiota bacterium]